MKCSEVMDLMQRHLDNDLHEREQDELRDHLQECTSCAEMFERLNRLSDELVSLPKVVPPVSLVDSIMPRLEEIDRERKEEASVSFWRKLGNKVPYRMLGGVAAACVLIALMAVQRTWFNPDDSADESALMNSASSPIASSAQDGAGAPEGGAEFETQGDFQAYGMRDQSGTPLMEKSAKSKPDDDQGHAVPERTVEPAEPALRDEGAGIQGFAGTAPGDVVSGGEIPPAPDGKKDAFVEPAGPPADWGGDAETEPEREAETESGATDEEALQYMISSFAGKMPGELPAVSPDGQYSALVEAVEEGVQVVILDQNGERIYASPVKPEGQITFMSWSDDSKFVNYVVAETDAKTGRVTETGYMIEVEARRELRSVDQ